MTFRYDADFIEYPVILSWNVTYNYGDEMFHISYKLLAQPAVFDYVWYIETAGFKMKYKYQEGDSTMEGIFIYPLLK